MGLKAGLQIIQQARKVATGYADDAVGVFCRKPVTVNLAELKGLRFAPEAIGDTVRFSVSNNFKNITQELLTTIKPSKFRSILASRKDIPKGILEEIDTSDKLALYDKTVDLLKERNLSDSKIKMFYKFIFVDQLSSARLPNVTAKLEIIPELLKKGYPEFAIAKMPVTDFNKKQILNVLAKREEIFKILGKDLKDESTKIMQLNDIIRYVDDNNVKYLEECLQHTKNAQNLVFWNSDSLKILKDLCEDIKDSTKVTNVLERIFRRNLSYDDVLKVAQNGKLSSKDIKLLEFINFDKLKNIGLDDLDKLSVEERKNLLDGFISSFRAVPGIGKDNIPVKKIEYLSSRMKIFENLDGVQTLTEYRDKYYETIRKIMNSIPDAERRAPINPTSLYRGMDQYLINNPIPALVDDLEKLPFKEIIVNGKKIKIIEIAKDTNLNLAIHQTADPRSILNLEAMEMTSDGLLCTGLKKFGSSEIHFGAKKFGVALKPQENTEIFLQSYTDIWSDGFTKTPYNMIRGSQKYLNDSAPSYIPELIKKELDLSQSEYTARIQKIVKATTLNEIENIDPELAKVIRNLTETHSMYEGLIKPDIMGVCVDANIPIQELNEDVLEFCARNNKRRLVRITGY